MEEAAAEEAAAPQKRFYRQRAHANPLADHTLRYPARPQDMDWAPLFPAFFPPAAPPGQPPPAWSSPTWAAATGGCWVSWGGGHWGGAGGLLVDLSLSPPSGTVPLFPHTLVLGLELRVKVAAFAGERIRALRAAQPGRFGNVACVRANAMKHLPHFFRKAQGLVYTVTDVAEVHEWMVKHFGEHPLFEEVPLAELAADPIVARLGTSTEEGRKVQRGGRRIFPAVFRRLQDPALGGGT
ncbi:unnamed protein product [Bubo scandiacus]